MGLKLKRRLGESIVIHDDETGKFVEIIISKIAGQKVELEFDDPEHGFNIVRTETITNWN